MNGGLQVIRSVPAKCGHPCGRLWDLSGPRSLPPPLLPSKTCRPPRSPSHALQQPSETSTPCLRGDEGVQRAGTGAQRERRGLGGVSRGPREEDASFPLDSDSLSLVLPLPIVQHYSRRGRRGPRPRIRPICDGVLNSERGVRERNEGDALE